VADSHEHGNKSLGFTDVPDQRNDYPAKTSYYVSKLTVSHCSQTQITARTTPTITVTFLLVSSVGWSSSHGLSPGSTPGQFMWDLCRTKWLWQRFLTVYCGYHSTNASHSFIRLSSTL